MITDIVLDLLDIQSSIFSLQSPSNCTVSLDSNFVRELGQMGKLGLREGKQLAKDRSKSILPYRIDIVCHEYSICPATDLQKGGRKSTKADQRPLSCTSENN